MDSWITDRPREASGLGMAAMAQFHRPQYLGKGNYNVGSGSLSYQGLDYPFYVQGIGSAGIGIADIEAKGVVYGLERIGDFSGAYVRAAAVTASGLWLRNEKGVIIHIAVADGVPLYPVSDAVTVRLNR